MIHNTGNDNLDAIERALINGIRKADNETARAIAGRARDKAPGTNNALKASIHAATDEGSDYASAVSRAVLANPRVGDQVLPAYPLDDANDPEAGYHVAVVDVPLKYAGLVHDGHYRTVGDKPGGQYVAGRPFLAEAAREEQAAHTGRVKKALQDLEKTG